MSYSCQVALVSMIGVGRLQSAPIPTRPGKAAAHGPVLRADDVFCFAPFPRAACQSGNVIVRLHRRGRPYPKWNEARARVPWINTLQGPLSGFTLVSGHGRAAPELDRVAVLGMKRVSTACHGSKAERRGEERRGGGGRTASCRWPISVCNGASKIPRQP
ncbi:hypothetical protein BDP81DRAFT_31989 [Colletotrichum phormii]|uniref:Uncharacterized protein n=1 Tax=Colletotrichum phormii TaxID=359342 RepID=A0AAJ0EGE8_9PEZI|nr:uncharacterized protein BDP81DRAFT_31989 [Colletotrichum phormii]KAK1635981.1 hypothetical protein BDP81DRAFT_31989 [Colletotrichum phormii]